MTSAEAEPPGPASRSSGPPLRGRDRETASILSLLRRCAVDGQGAVVVVSGAGGVGKTALLRSVAGQAQELGYDVGSSKAEQIEEIAPGTPLLTALRSGPRPLIDATGFASLSALHQRPLWLVDRVAELLADRGRSPVLVTIDDLQWADDLSLFALRVLPPRLSGFPVVWLLTTREPVSPDQLELGGSVVREVTYLPIPLEPLSPHEILALATDRLGASPPPPLRRRLADVEGSPLLAVELVDGMGLDPTGESLPPNLVAGVRRRLGTLSPGALELVRTGSVIGRAFALADAAAVLGVSPPSALFGSLQECVDGGVLVDDGDLLHCRHDLLREAVHTDLVPAVRTHLHRRAGEHLLATGRGALAAAPPGGASAAAGDLRAVGVLRAAAAEVADALPRAAVDLAADAYGLLGSDDELRPDVGEEYLRFLVQAQRNVDALVLADELLGSAPSADAVARIQLLAAEALWPMGRTDEIAARLDAALALGVDEIARGRLEAGQALVLTRTATAEVAARAGDRTLAEGRRLGDRRIEELGHQVLGEAARNDGRHSDALLSFQALRGLAGPEYLPQEALALQLLDRYDEAEEILRRGDGADGRTAARSDLPSFLFAQLWQDFGLNRFEATDAVARTLINLGDELGNRIYQLDALMIQSSLDLASGEFAAAAAKLRQVEGLLEEGDGGRAVGLTLSQGWLRAASGDVAGGLALLSPLMADAAESRSYWPWFPGWMSVLVRIGLGGQDLAFAWRAVELAELGAERNPEVASFVGLALQVRGLVTHDVSLLERAVAELERSPRPMLLANAHADLGGLLLRRGDREPGVVEMEKAWDAYNQLDARAGAAAAKNALAAVGIRRSRWSASGPRPTSGWDALTRTEQQVTLLVAEGHTNRTAAEHLFLSPNTVATHLRSVFTKMEVRSRVQLSLAVRQQLGAAGGSAGPGT